MRVAIGGIACPVCGNTDSKVLETRRHEGTIIRRRRCFGTRKHTFQTVELLADAPEEKLPATTTADAVEAPFLVGDLMEARGIVEIMDRALAAILKKAKGEE